MKKILICLLFLALVCGCSNEDVDEKDFSNVNSIAELKGSKIAVQTDLHEDLAKQIEDVEYTFYDNFDMCATAVKSGVMDGAIMDEPAAISYCNKDDSFGYIKLANNDNGFTVSKADYANAAAFKKGNELCTKVNEIISAIDMNTYYQLMEEVLLVSAGKEIDSFVLDKYTSQDTSNGTLIVGMECASEPFNWTDVDGASFGSETIAYGAGAGEPCNGLDVQVAKYVAAQLGYKLEVYALEWDSLLPALDSEAIDVIIGNMSPREDRIVKYDFTESYYDVNYVVLYKK